MREMRKKVGDGIDDPASEVAKATATPTEEKEAAKRKTGSPAAEAS